MRSTCAGVRTVCGRFEKNQGFCKGEIKKQEQQHTARVLSLTLHYCSCCNAEREGFEPSVPSQVHTLSKRARSASLTSLRSPPLIERMSD
jgi:hypothetical protein